MPGSFEVGDLVTADLLNTATYRPYCKVHQTVAQTGLATGSTTVLTYTTEDHDPEGWHDNVTNNSRITPTLAGEYEVTVEVALVADADTTSVAAAIFFNGALYSRIGGMRPNVTVLSTGSTHTDTITLNGTTDYVESAVVCSASAGTNDTNVTSSGQSRMIVRFLGANA
jgi:hypothetical protein